MDVVPPRMGKHMGYWIVDNIGMCCCVAPVAMGQTGFHVPLNRLRTHRSANAMAGLMHTQLERVGKNVVQKHAA